MPQNNGAMILVAVKDRKMRIELGKFYGHRKYKLMQRIVDKVMVPNFKKGLYTAHLLKGVKEVEKALTSPLYVFIT